MRLQKMNGLALADALLEELNRQDDLDGYQHACRLLGKVALNIGDVVCANEFDKMSRMIPRRR
jgi:hypothetical protein